MNSRFIAAALIATLTFGSAHAEKWACYSGYGQHKKDLFILTSDNTQPDSQFQSGTVDVAGKSQTAIYYIDGLNRRWDWGWGGNGQPAMFSIIIKPTGAGSYYNFSLTNPTPPEQTFPCEQR